MREPRPVIRAEVTEKNKTLRIIAAVVLLLCLLFVFVLSIDSVLEERWNNIVKSALVAAPFIMAACTTIYYGYRIKNISKRNYKVIRDTVERVVTDNRTVTKYCRGRRVITTEHAMLSISLRTYRYFASADLYKQRG